MTRTLAIGDIHGCLKAFDTLLDMVRPDADDVLVTLGDYVDRGPDSKGVIERLIALKSICRLAPLKGNHDLMMLDSLARPDVFRDWLSCGGRATVQSYANELTWESFVEHFPVDHEAFVAADCAAYHEADEHFFVHANVYPELPLDEQPDYMLYWEKISGQSERRHGSGKIMVCGHTQQRSGRPLVLDHAVCIDTWVYGDGWLTCLDVENEAYWQANQRGETRCGLLDFRER